MIVHTFGPALGTIDLSPFVVKLLAWLRLAGIAHAPALGDLRKAPAGKLPAVTLDSGEVLGDSQRIIERLAAQHGDPLGEARWSPAEQASARAWRALFETDLYFANMHGRWMDDANWALFKPVMGQVMQQMGVPGLLVPLVLRQARAKVRAQLHAQGTGRMTPAHIAEHGISGYAAVAQFLGDKPFMLGERASALDATAFGFLHTLLVAPFASPIKDFVAGQPQLVAYEQRLRAQFEAAAHSA